MDPNATLAELRALCAANTTGDSEFIDEYDACRIVELTMALDEWISNGGFQPTAWLVPVTTRR